MTTASAPLTDLAWLGEHAAARLPAQVRLRAEGPMVPTLTGELERLRALAPGSGGSLDLLDLPRAREAGLDRAVLDQLTAAGDEAYALHADGERLTVIGGGNRGLLYGF